VTVCPTKKTATRFFQPSKELAMGVVEFSDCDIYFLRVVGSMIALEIALALRALFGDTGRVNIELAQEKKVT
jgi:hypothetical protein